jgi:hypothetical protein
VGTEISNFRLKQRGDCELGLLGSEATRGAPVPNAKVKTHYPSRLCFRLFTASQNFFWRR